VLVETGARAASRLRVILIASVTCLAVASGVAAQQPPAEPVQPPAETPPSAPLDATRPVVPSPPVNLPTPPVGTTPGTTVVPPPTVPSAQRPDLLVTGLPAIPGAVFQPHFGIGVSEEFSDNFFLSKDKTRSNFRSMLTPGVGLDINGAFTKGRAVYTLSAIHDTVRAEDDVFLAHAFAGLVTWQATPLLSLTLSDTLTRSDEPDQAGRLSLRRERDPFLSNSFNALAQYRLGVVTAGLTYSWSTFFGSNEGNTNTHTFGVNASTPIGETNTLTVGYEYLLSNTSADRSGGGSDEEITGHRVYATFARQLTSLLTAGVTSSYAIRRSDAHHDDTSSDVGSGVAIGNDYDMWSVALFNSYSGPRLLMTGSIGYTRIEPTRGRAESSVLTTTSISYRFARAIATLTVDSGFSETFADGQNFGVVETRGATLSLYYPLTPFIDTNVTGLYRTNTTAGSSDDQQTWGINASATFRFTRWLGLLLEYNHREVSGGTLRSATGVGSSTFGSEYTENRARISLNAWF